MTIYKIIVSSLLALFICASGAFAAGYMKIGDIKGESTDRESSREDLQSLDSGETDEPAGLLLPAVQKVRRNSRPSTDSAYGDDEKKGHGKVDVEWKVEKGEK